MGGYNNEEERKMLRDAMMKKRSSITGGEEGDLDTESVSGEVEEEEEKIGKEALQTRIEQITRELRTLEDSKLRAHRVPPETARKIQTLGSELKTNQEKLNRIISEENRIKEIEKQRARSAEISKRIKASAGGTSKEDLLAAIRTGTKSTKRGIEVGGGYGTGPEVEPGVIGAKKDLEEERVASDQASYDAWVDYIKNKDNYVFFLEERLGAELAHDMLKRATTLKRIDLDIDFKNIGIEDPEVLETLKIIRDFSLGSATSDTMRYYRFNSSLADTIYQDGKYRDRRGKNLDEIAQNQVFEALRYLPEISEAELARPPVAPAAAISDEATRRFAEEMYARALAAEREREQALSLNQTLTEEIGRRGPKLDALMTAHHEENRRRDQEKTDLDRHHKDFESKLQQELTRALQEHQRERDAHAAEITAQETRHNRELERARQQLIDDHDAVKKTMIYDIERANQRFVQEQAAHQNTQKVMGENLARAQTDANNARDALGIANAELADARTKLKEARDALAAPPPAVVFTPPPPVVPASGIPGVTPHRRMPR